MSEQAYELSTADALFATASGYAAHCLQSLRSQGDGHLLERDLKKALAEGLASQGAEVRSEAHYQLPNWDPQPGAVDVSVGRDGEPHALAELKWANENKVWEMLWDALKLANALAVDTVTSAYLVCGAPDASWHKPVQGAEVFDPGVCQFVDLIRRNEEWWTHYQIPQSAGSPLRGPSQLEITKVADVRLTIRDLVWRLRTVRIHPAGEPVEFRDGIPA
ncbi:MAG TPA: hypothetical protein VMB51_09495 [Solirubrobacteraceae bacterium]|nr:hypothetical protein [Solirubrobacteraceae bacterium]